MNGAALIVLAAGGTGGHIFPAQSLAEELLQRGHRLALVTDRRGADYGGALARIDRHMIRAGTLSGGGLGGKISGLMNVVAGVLQARALLSRLRPKAAIGFGGYPSLPTMLAAARLKIPAATHEQNAVLGRVNRFLASRVDAIALSLEATRFLNPSERRKASLTGNPVRSEVREERETPYRAPREGEIRVLIAGGSQGAAVLSNVVPQALAELPGGLRARLRIAQQCRAEDLERVKSFYAEAGIEADLSTFIEDMPRRIGAAHFVITRAGASTIAELTVVGRPAILVPYPFATDDHQTANAQALADAGAGWIMPQRDLTAAAVTEKLAGLLGDDAALDAAARAARGLGRPDAAERLADLVEGLVGVNGGGVRADAMPTEEAA